MSEMYKNTLVSQIAFEHTVVSPGNSTSPVWLEPSSGQVDSRHLVS